MKAAAVSGGMETAAVRRPAAQGQPRTAPSMRNDARHATVRVAGEKTRWLEHTHTMRAMIPRLSTFVRRQLLDLYLSAKKLFRIYGSFETAALYSPAIALPIR